MSVKIKLDSNGIQQILKSDEVAAVCQQQADKALRKLGEGFSSDKYVGRKRVNVRVFAESERAYWKSIKNNVLLKAFGGKAK